MAERSIEWLLKTGKVVEEHWWPPVLADQPDALPPPSLVERRGFWGRPPIGPPLAGSRATAAGRSHRWSQSTYAKERRRRLALEAYRLRLQGASIRAIAARIGVGKSTVGKWLFGVYPNRPELEALYGLLGIEPHWVPNDGPHLQDGPELVEVPFLDGWPSRWGPAPWLEEIGCDCTDPECRGLVRRQRVPRTQHHQEWPTGHGQEATMPMIGDDFVSTRRHQELREEWRKARRSAKTTDDWATWASRQLGTAPTAAEVAAERVKAYEKKNMKAIADQAEGQRRDLAAIRKAQETGVDHSLAGRHA